MTAPSVDGITWDENTTSRFKILERPFRSPGKCSCCGAVDRPVVDFGFNLNRYGAVMLCVTCVSEAAERIGMVRPEDHEAEKLQTGQSVEDYLNEHNLKVVTNELYDSLARTVGYFSADRALNLHSLSPVGSENLQGVLDFDADEPRTDDQVPDDFKL